MTTENEIAKRRRVHELAHQIADLFTDIADRYVELRDLGVDPKDVTTLTVDHFSPIVRQELEGGFLESMPFFAEGAYQAISAAKLPESERAKKIQEFAAQQLQHGHLSQLPPDIHAGMKEIVDLHKRDPGFASHPMKRVIARLFEQAPRVVETDDPALECQVVLKSGMPLTGSLGRTPEGALKMLVPAQGPNGQTLLAECFFAYEDLQTVIFQRAMTAETPKIITLQ